MSILLLVTGKLLHEKLVNRDIIVLPTDPRVREYILPALEILEGGERLHALTVKVRAKTVEEFAREFGDEDIVGAYWPSRKEIWVREDLLMVRPDPHALDGQDILLHEYGHALYYQELTEAERAAYVKLWHVLRQRYFDPTQYRWTSPAEGFAEAFMAIFGNERDEVIADEERFIRQTLLITEELDKGVKDGIGCQSGTVR